MSARGLLAGTRDGGWVPYYDPARDPLYALTDEHRLALELFEVVVWGLTIVFALVDLLSTAVGLPHPFLVEAVPLTLVVVERFGVLGLAVEHVLTLGLLAALWQLLPRPYRVVVPLEGAWAGYLITHNNLVVLLTSGALPVG